MLFSDMLEFCRVRSPSEPLNNLCLKYILQLDFIWQKLFCQKRWQYNFCQNEYPWRRPDFLPSLDPLNPFSFENNLDILSSLCNINPNFSCQPNFQFINHLRDKILPGVYHISGYPESMLHTKKNNILLKDICQYITCNSNWI